MVYQSYRVRTRIKIRGLNVKPRTKGPREYQERIQYAAPGYNAPTPRIIRMSRPSTPAVQPKRDLRQEVEIIRKHFDLPNRV
jgi:ribosomal protein S30